MVPARGTETFGEIPIRPRHNSPEIVNIEKRESFSFQSGLELMTTRMIVEVLTRLAG